MRGTITAGRSKFPTATEVRSLSGAMRDLGRDLIWELLACLAESPISVSRLAAKVELSVSDVSKALKRLKAYGLVTATQERDNTHVHALTDRVAVQTRERRIEVMLVCRGDGVVTIRRDLPGADEDSRLGQGTCPLRGRVAVQESLIRSRPRRSRRE